jgi:hypothetical protein
LAAATNKKKSEGIPMLEIRITGNFYRIRIRSN